VSSLTTRSTSAAKPRDSTSIEPTRRISKVNPDLAQKAWDGELLKRDRSQDPRLPRSVQAIYLKPLKRKAQYGVPSCDLQLRSYNVRNVEFFADFALRAAYYLNLPAAGPVPLPRITERWTVPRSNFIFKKSQENFERITLRRLIQIQDGHPDSVEIWLAFLRKHTFYGIGMKANVWRHEKLGKRPACLCVIPHAKSPSRRWQDYGCQLREPEAGYGAEVGTFRKTENT